MKRTAPNTYGRGVLEAATGNSTLNPAAKRYMRAKAELKRLE